MYLRFDPFTGIVLAILIGGLVNMIVVDLSHEDHVESETETRLCLACWNSRVEVRRNGENAEDE